jgi:hypothetical protein
MSGAKQGGHSEQARAFDWRCVLTDEFPVSSVSMSTHTEGKSCEHVRSRYECLF